LAVKKWFKGIAEGRYPRLRCHLVKEIHPVQLMQQTLRGHEITGGGEKIGKAVHLLVHFANNTQVVVCIALVFKCLHILINFKCGI